MKVYSRGQKPGQKFYYSVNADEFESRLEIPDGRNPNQNAWLTITINYSLRFADGKSQGAGIIFQKDGKYFARDVDGKEFPVKDWDFKSQSEFNKRFLQGENFWNYKFLLTTPTDYDGLDYTSWAGPGWLCRPNVICLFRLNSGGEPNHLPLTVVRTGDTNFRSSHFTYDDQDVYNKTLWHELGHALDQLHIKALLGDAKCLVDVNHDDCYKEPAGVPPNIQGSGTGLLPVNAKPWQELIEHHTGIPRFKWLPTMLTDQPARKLPMGFQVRNVMPKNW